MNGEMLLISALQNGISQKAKLELLRGYKDKSFGEGYEYCSQVFRRSREIKKAEIKKRSCELIDKLREEIWRNNETHNKS